MSGDYETLENNQPKISYFKKSKDNTEWLDNLINKIEDMKKNISKAASWKTGRGTIKKLFIVDKNSLS